MSKVTVAVIGTVLAAALGAFLLIGKENRSVKQTEIANTSSVEGVPVVSAPLPAKTDVVPLPLEPAASPAEPGPPAYVAYPADFDRIFKNQHPDRDYSMVAAMHAAMEREARDPHWAADREDELQRTFLDRSEMARYGRPTVECRSTLCEMRWVVRGTTEKELFKDLLRPGDASSVKRTPPSMVFSSADERNGTTALVVQASYGTSAPPGVLPPTGGGSGRPVPNPASP